MPEFPTATIIPFPARATAPAESEPSAPRTTEPTPAEIRLSRALIGLNDAVMAQRDALAGWKSALTELQTVTGRLGASLRNYHDNLGHLDTRVATLHSEATKLEAWADGVLAKEG